MPTPRYITAHPSVLLAALGACALILAFTLAAYAVQAQGQDVTETEAATGDDPPTHPGRPTAEVSHDSVTLTWTKSSDDTVTHYAVLRRNRDNDKLGEFQVIQANAGPELSYTDSTVEAESSYVYRVKAVSPTGVSRWSGYVTADTPSTPPPTATPEPTPTPTPDPAFLAPSGLSAFATQDSGVFLTWDAPQEDAGAVTGYEVLRAQGEADLTTLAADTGNTGTSYTDATATEPGETFAYRVRALRGEEKSQASNRTAAVIPTQTLTFIQVDGDPPVAEPDETTPREGGVPPVAPRQNATNNPATGRPSITGAAQVGQTLTAEVALSGPVPAGVVAAPQDWSLIPDGVTGGQRFRLIFLTETGQAPSSTEITTYNTYVQAQANASNAHADIKAYSSGFKVLGSTDDVDARDNTATTHTAADRGVPIYWLNGTKVADDYQDLYDGAWHDEANPTNRQGNVVSAGVTIFTGSNDAGQEKLLRGGGSGSGGSRAFGAMRVNVGQLNSSASTRRPLDTSTAALSDVTTLPYYALSAVLLAPGISDDDGIPDDPVYTYQWSRSADGATYTPIDGATGATYTLSESDLNRFIRVEVSFTDSLGAAEGPLPSLTTASVAPPALPGFDLDDANDNPSGVWGNETTIWVAEDDGANSKIFAYNLDGTRVSAKDIGALSAAGNQDPRGLWSDGVTMFVLDDEDVKVYAYKMIDDPSTDTTNEFGQQDTSLEISLNANNNEAQGLWGSADHF